MQSFPLEFLCARSAGMLPSVWEGTLPGMVDMEKGKGSEPDVSAAWVPCGGTGEARVLCAAGRWLWQATWEKGEVLDELNS